VIVDNAPHGREVCLDPQQLNLGKRLLGTWGGDSDPDRDYPRYARLLDSGRLHVRSLLNCDYTLQRINDALDDLANGRAVRPVVRMDGEMETTN
jgi:S-(hydroxymethyl)glutathione dehydrogenase/alcohol dehydrogenase